MDKLNALYVALTRAKHELHIIGVKKKSDKFPFDLLEPGVPSGEGRRRLPLRAVRCEFPRGAAAAPEGAKGGI